MKIIIPIIIFLQLMISCNSQQSLDDYIYSKKDSIEGQIHTAKMLRYYMDNKQYQKAVNLFSVKQQKNINEAKTLGMFEHWCYAWTFDQNKYDR